MTMPLNGVNHIAVLTKDMERFIHFYEEAFGAKVLRDTKDHGGNPGERMVVMSLGGPSHFNVFVVPGNTQAEVQTPMYGRGRIDHFGLNASNAEQFEQIRQQLIKLGASDGQINDFGSSKSVFFRDPDGLEAEVLLPKDSA